MINHRVNFTIEILSRSRVCFSKLISQLKRAFKLLLVCYTHRSKCSAYLLTVRMTTWILQHVGNRGQMTLENDFKRSRATINLTLEW